FYYYRHNPLSTTNQIVTKKHIDSIEYAINDINNLINSYENELGDSKLNYNIWIYSMLINNKIIHGLQNRIKYKYIDEINYIKSLNFTNVLLSKNISIINKRNYILIKFNLYIILKIIKFSFDRNYKIKN